MPRHALGRFGSLLLYGRQIFQLCLGTLLIGIDLAERADLEEKFVSNNERYQRICDLLKAETRTPAEKLLSLEPTLSSLRRYQFVATGELSRATVIAAVRYIAATLIASGHTFASDLTDALAAAHAEDRGHGEFVQLDLIHNLAEVFKATESSSLPPEARVARDIV